jgi:hypothetical protein
LLARYDADVIVFGHTHQPLVTYIDGRWVANPGAAGPRRFGVQPTVGRLRISEGRVAVEIVQLAS